MKKAKTAFLARNVPTLPVLVLPMPLAKKKLSKCERLMLRFWIGQGARNNRGKCYLRKIQQQPTRDPGVL